MISLIDWFDQTYVVNLADRKDRLRDISAELRRVGVEIGTPKVLRFDAIRPKDRLGFPSAAVRGCFESHMNIIRTAHAQRLNSVLIIEDDLNISPLLAKYSGALASRLNRGDWDIVYLGHVEGHLTSQEPHLVPYTDPVATAHFYGLNGRTLDRLLKYLEEILERQPGDPRGGPMHFDGALSMFRQANANIVTLISCPSLGRQRSSRSDIHGRWFEKVIGLRQLADWGHTIRGYMKDQAARRAGEKRGNAGY